MLVLIVALVTRIDAITQTMRNGALGYSLALAAAFLLFLLFRYPSLLRGLETTLFFALMVVGLYAISVMYSREAGPALVTVSQLVLILSWLFFVSLVPWSRSIILTASTLFAVMVLLNFVLWVSQGFPTQYVGFLAHKNTLGAILFSGLFFLIHLQLGNEKPLVRVTFVLVILLSLVLLWATGSRTSQLSFLAAVSVYLLWPVIGRARLPHALTFGLLLLFSIGVIYFYVELWRYDFFAALSEWAQRYTQGGLYSGRELLWPDALDYISRKPLFGWGAGFQEERVLVGPLGQGQATHNLSLAIALQTGLFGAILFWGFLASVWSVFYRKPDIPVVRLSAAFFCGIVVNQSFELSLTQNNVSVGILFWTIMGVGLNATLKGAPSAGSLPPPAEQGP